MSQDQNTTGANTPTGAKPSPSEEKKAEESK